MKLYKILFKISIYISIKFFHLRLPLPYVLYNFLYKKFILNTKNHNDSILNFDRKGFSKLDIDFAEIINKYNIKHSKIKEEKFNNHRTYFFLENKYKKLFQIDLIKRINPIIKELESYYNLPIYLLNFKAFRIEYFNNAEDKDLELYANKFHNDGYVMNFFKVFVNLEDVTDKDGPLHLISKEDTKKFIQSSKYRNRDNYNSEFDKSIVFKNTGKKGSSLIFSPSLCFHKAGVPEKCRDMIQLVFAALPLDKKKLPNENIDIFDENNEFISSTKPFGFFKSMEFFVKNFKFKIA